LFHSQATKAQVNELRKMKKINMFSEVKPQSLQQKVAMFLSLALALNEWM